MSEIRIGSNETGSAQRYETYTLVYYLGVNANKITYATQKSSPTLSRLSRNHPPLKQQRIGPPLGRKASSLWVGEKSDWQG